MDHALKIEIGPYKNYGKIEYRTWFVLVAYIHTHQRTYGFCVRICFSVAVPVVQPQAPKETLTAGRSLSYAKGRVGI